MAGDEPMIVVEKEINAADLHDIVEKAHASNQEVKYAVSFGPEYKDGNKIALLTVSVEGDSWSVKGKATYDGNGKCTIEASGGISFEICGKKAKVEPLIAWDGAKSVWKAEATTKINITSNWDIAVGYKYSHNTATGKDGNDVSATLTFRF